MPRREDVARAGGTTGRAAWRLVILLGALAATPLSASAATFDVNATILCPASLTAAGTFNPAFTTAVNRPCAGIRVVAMDSDPGFDEYCGAGYTDARGRVLFRAECGDTIRPLPDVYLRIEGKSLEGFSVGVVETDALDRLVDGLEHAWERFVEDGVPIGIPELDVFRKHQTFAWLSPTSMQVREGGSLGFGALIIGAPGTGAVSVMAGRQYWAAQFAMFRLGAGTRYRPMHFNYTVDAPLPPITLAFTAYDTVVIDFTRSVGPRAAAALRSTAHEIGHVLYNTYHSDNLHWVGDCLGVFCFRNSDRCASVHLDLAWYEGFADFVRDYVHQIWNWPTWSWTTAPPPPGCALEPPPPPPGVVAVDMSVEGNVEGLLNNVYFGPVRPALLTAANPTSGGLAFGCPDGITMPSPAPPGGNLVCPVTAPVTCATGTLAVDATGARDACRDWVDDPRCARAPNRTSPNFSCPYDPVPQTNPTSCAGVRATVPGRDTCTTLVPATHTLPNGRPRPRPDGTPDMQLGTARTGGQAWFSLPTLDDVVGWVDEAGTDDHRAKEFWDNRIRPWCTRGDGSLRDRYCHPLRSPSFAGELLTLDPAFRLR